MQNEYSKQFKMKWICLFNISHIELKSILTLKQSLYLNNATKFLLNI